MILKSARLTVDPARQTVAVRKRVTKSIEEFFAIGVLVLNIYASRLIRNLI